MIAVNAPNTARDTRVRLSQPFLKSTPARKPMIPIANICQGVHGPCENSILEVSIVTAPTRNPASPPKATPAIMVSASTGLNCGSIKNKLLPAIPIAQSTAMVTSSLALGFLPSNTRINGSIHSSNIKSATRLYCLSSI